ncbi:sigma-54-dependent Fis family transcriptional regulator [Sediminibacterium roseum]|uniref:Sigma-54-dependent Fis family transcriptional regulator n=1 Tax=Sediminibacterium roseum TaxID=1978412 RepID=A0ABW9ZXZ6_9BACT|nr:sigma-54 dependent transcriptional regulator [Sediminibacterium roseum]NCI52036.1 sigma-54-dependent Fis family transcriptional regulator [Sediminibacterium roseum]
MGTILIIDDEGKLRGLLSRVISLEGFSVLQAGTIKAGKKILESEAVDVLLCDVKLPDGSGVDVVKPFKQKFPFLEIILLTAYGNIPDGVQAMKDGAFDYITKGDDNGKIIPLLGRAMEKINLQKRIHTLEQKVSKQYGFNSIIGESKEIKEAITLARKAAPTDATILLLGETGTGKEVFAQAIHNESARAAKPFQALNCSALSKELLESELFGYKAGAFTGANQNKTGLLEEANKGTLFLDEVGDMPADLQAKLLRVLENHSFIKVGDTSATSVDVRIIAATNRDLSQDVKDGKFREDLYYRLNIFTIHLPPLRNRKEDIPLLAQYYLDVFSAKTNLRVHSMSDDFLLHLQQHAWKGNIRELKNVIERAVILCDGTELTSANLPADVQNADGEAESSFNLSVVEKLHIKKTLNHTNGNKSEAARLLGIGTATLYRKIDEYKIG